MSLKRRHVSRGDGRPNQRIETGILARATESRRTLTDIICHGGDEGCGASFGHGRVRASRIAAEHGVFSLDLDERGRGWAVGAVRNRVLGGFASCLWARSLRPWERRRPWPPALARATVRSGWCRGRSQPRGDAPRLCLSGPGDRPVPGLVSRSRSCAVGRSRRAFRRHGQWPLFARPGRRTSRSTLWTARGTRCPRPARGRRRRFRSGARLVEYRWPPFLGTP